MMIGKPFNIYFSYALWLEWIGELLKRFLGLIYVQTTFGNSLCGVIRVFYDGEKLYVVGGGRCVLGHLELLKQSDFEFKIPKIPLKPCLRHVPPCYR